MGARPTVSLELLKTREMKQIVLKQISWGFVADSVNSILSIPIGRYDFSQLCGSS